MNYKDILMKLVEDSDNWARCNSSYLNKDINKLKVRFDYFDGMQAMYPQKFRVTLFKGSFKAFMKEYIVDNNGLKLSEDRENEIWDMLSKDCLISMMLEKSSFQYLVETGKIALQ